MGPATGAGGFAQLWQGWRVDDDAPVAIKVGHASTAHACEKLAHEARALDRIGPPHVPRFYQQGVLDDGRPYVVMEYLDGPTLAQVLAGAPTPLDLCEAGRIAAAVLASLEAVHACGYLHLDLTPENIFVPTGQSSHARLVDFGLVRAAHDTGAPPAVEHTAEAVVAGTIEYTAPERLTGRTDVDARTDIYGFGVILYELLTLRVPFVGDPVSIARGHCALRPPPPDAFAAVPEALAALCLDCLRKEPAARPAGAAAVAQRLAAAVDQAGTGSRQAGGATRAPRGGLLDSAHQPVVLLAIELPGVDLSAARTVARHRGFMARQHGRRAVCAFAALHDDRPVDLALRAARALRDEHGARVAVHVIGLRLRPGKDGRAPRLYGTAVDQPARWMPGGDWTGIRLTAAVAELLPPHHSQPAPGDPAFRVLVDEAPEAQPGARVDEPALVGCEAILDAARESLRATMHTQTPGLVTLLGDHGAGKSRLCRELAALVQRAHPEARVITVRAGKHTDLDELARRLDELLHATAGPAPVSARREAHADETWARAPDAVRGLGRLLHRVATRVPLAVIIDDLHYAGDAALDALEYAALDAASTTLWIAVAAHPRLERRRPQWGQRAFRHQRVRVAALDPEPAMSLAAALLRPVEYPPRATLALLARWTAGNPQALVDLVHTLKRAGIVRQGRQGGSWYVATAAIEQLPVSPVGQWLASRALADLPPDVAACARTCAVLGVEPWRDELYWVQGAAERAGTAGTPIDTDVGLAALARAGILHEVRPGVWRFVRVAMQSGTYELVAARDRAHIHAHALAFWQRLEAPADPERALRAVARHADAAGARDIAARAYLDLGARAGARWRDVDADRYYTQALQAIEGEGSPTHLHALRGRGRARYRLHRIQDAIDDIARARTQAQAARDDALLAHLLIDEATALDWAEKHAESAMRVERARLVVARLGDPVLRGRHLMASGRSAFRAGRTDEAIELLARACAITSEHDDHETRVIALLLLGPVYVLEERLDDAERCFDEVIALCERIGDRFHLCVAYNNRSYLWVAKRSLQGIMSDLGRSRQIARESGWPVLERGAAHNLAEFLHWSGAHDNALALARRAYALRRFLPDPVPADALLLARVLVAGDHVDEARAVAEEARDLLHAAGAGELEDLVLGMLDLSLGEPVLTNTKYTWEELVIEARARLPDEEYLEVLYFRGRVAARGQRWQELARVLDDARERLDQCPIWQGPFAALSSSLPATHVIPDDRRIHR